MLHMVITVIISRFNIRYVASAAISCILTCFVRQQIGDASKLFRYGGCPNHRSRNLGVFLNHPTENHFSHIQIDA